MKEHSSDLFRRADIVRFNREANDRAPTEWFTSLKSKKQASINRSLEKHAASLYRQANKALLREFKEQQKKNRTK